MKEAVIVGYLRSPFSRSRPTDPDRDVLNSFSMDELGAKVVNELFNRTRGMWMNSCQVAHWVLGRIGCGEEERFPCLLNFRILFLQK